MSTYPNKVYTGIRSPDGGAGEVLVSTDGSLPKLLNPRHDLRNHSPDGFQWSYGGSGPAQLALAILVEERGERQALELYQSFKGDVIAGIKTDQFTLNSAEIRTWIIGHQSQ